MTDAVDPPAPERHLATARALMHELGLVEVDDVRVRPVSGHNSSLLVPCRGRDGSPYLLKLFVPPAEGVFYPSGIRIEDYARREAGFYRFLDSVDPARKQLPAPRTIVIDAGDPPRWILLEWIEGAVGPAAEVLGMDHVFDVLQRLQAVGFDTLIGRRDFPLSHWEPTSYLERIRLMYDPTLFVVGEERWRRMQRVLEEALRWIETRTPRLVHGDFTEQNILVDTESRPFLVDFERVGVGSEDHDFAWLWIHSDRPQAWKRKLLSRYFGERMGSSRIRSEWGIRAALIYLALRRLRFGYLTDGDEDALRAANLALLDATLAGGSDLFPE